MTWKMVELEEGTPVVYVGVYVLHWRPEWGQPDVGFVSEEHDEEDVADLITENARLRGKLGEYTTTDELGKDRSQDADWLRVHYFEARKENERMKQGISEVVDMLDEAIKANEPYTFNKAVRNLNKQYRRLIGMLERIADA